jgi:hypothetical protein
MKAVVVLLEAGKFRGFLVSPLGLKENGAGMIALTVPVPHSQVTAHSEALISREAVVHQQLLS